METHRDKPMKACLPVVIVGTQADGAEFHQPAVTTEIKGSTAQLIGLNCEVRPGSILVVQRKGVRARFQVIWVGAAETQEQGQIGVRSLEPGKSIWGVAL